MTRHRRMGGASALAAALLVADDTTCLQSIYQLNVTQR